MKGFSSLFTLIICATAVPHIMKAWTYRYGEDGYPDVGYCVQETFDSCYIVTGYTKSVPGVDRDLCILKIDREGVLLWSRIYGGEWGDVGYSIQQTPDSGYIITGCTDWSNEEGGADVWLLRTDPNGDSLWSRTYGGDSNDFACCLDQTSDGGYIIAGSTESIGLGKNDGWIIKTDSLGDTLWTGTYGGEEEDSFSYVEQTEDGSFILTGSHMRPFDPGYYNLWLIKIDQNGDSLWEQSYGENNKGEIGSCVRQTIDGGYIVIGTTPYSTAPWLIKTDAAGEIVWDHEYSPSYSGGRSVEQTADGGYILTGEMAISDYELFLIKTDPNGDTLWRRIYSGSGEMTTDRGHCVHQTSDGGYIVAGQREDGSSLYKDLWVLKTNPYGDTVWYDFSPTNILEPQEGGNYFSFVPLAVFTHMGTKTYEDLFYSYCEVTDLSDSSRIYIDSVPCIGSYRPGESIEIEFSEWTAPDTSEFEATFYARDSEGRELSSMPASVVFKWTGIGEEFIEHPSYYVTFSIGREVVLQYSNFSQGFSASVFDATGRKVADLQSAEPSGTLTWGEDRSPGVYFVRVASEKSVKTQKLILIR